MTDTTGLSPAYTRETTSGLAAGGGGPRVVNRTETRDSGKARGEFERQVMTRADQLSARSLSPLLKRLHSQSFLCPHLALRFGLTDCY
jgi:hypothetical protein